MLDLRYALKSLGGLIFIASTSVADLIPFTLHEGETLIVTYEHPIPHTIPILPDLEVNHIQATVRYERSTEFRSVREDIFTDEGILLYSETTRPWNVGIGAVFDVFDSSLPNNIEISEPHYVEIEQYQDGVGSDRFSIGFSPVLGSYRITGFVISFYNSQGVYEQGWGQSFMDNDDFSYVVIPEPGGLSLFLLGGAGLWLNLNRRGERNRGN